MPRKQTRHVPLAWNLCVQWKERGYKEQGWPELTWFLETAMRRKLRLARKAHGPTGVDIALNRKSRKREAVELDELAGHLSEVPTSVNALHTRTGWHHSKVNRLLTRLQGMKRATKSTEGDGWLAAEGAKPPENGHVQESTARELIPANSNHVEVKVGRVGWVRTEVVWSKGLGHVAINCDRCGKNTDVYCHTDKPTAVCYGCDATMPVRKARNVF
jgi:hypothetical protein